ESRFPRIYSTCMEYNIDIATDLIPVRPAAHYAMGGVRTDLHGLTSLPGLYAAGEVACTGVHGANRLASNSLLEGVVFGARAARAMRDQMKPKPAKSTNSHPAMNNGKAGSGGPGASVEQTVQKIRDLMWKNAGIVRDEKNLRHAQEQLEALHAELPAPKLRRQREAHNLLTTALLITRSALARKESRGAHYRLDYPLHDDAHFRLHSVTRQREDIHFQ
ncbi:MAG TPA: FAD-binding protein, partial [Candidatus Angelobacter sp.]|nr:FAD-binding protein [Candidatus Angelobacter sp.]